MRYLLLVLLTACGASATAPIGGTAHPGTFALATLSGSPLPVTVYVVDRVSSGTLVLRDDLTYTETFNATGQTGPITLVENGTYTASGSRITFTINYGPRYVGDVQANGDLITTGGRFDTLYHPA